jgi:hypothetical protein
MRFHKYLTLTVVRVLVSISTQTLFYLATHMTATLKLLSLLEGSAALNADPVCHQSGSVSVSPM